MKKIIIITVLFLVFNAALGAKYYPGIAWREISDQKFIVIFPVGYESEARYTLNVAHEIYDKSMRLWSLQDADGNIIRNAGLEKHLSRNRMRIVLSDSYDYANGSATFFPFNRIEIYLHEPGPDSEIATSRDWIYMVLTHEMGHIFNLNAGSGFSYFWRRIFGSNPGLYPMIYAPVWMMEGAAVYAESQLNTGGRLDTPDFKIMMRNIGAAGKIPDSARLYGESTAWPGPNAKYLFGAEFVSFLVEKYGEQKVRRLVYDFGYKFIPQVMGYRFKKVFGKSLNVLWDEFIAGAAAAGRAEREDSPASSGVQIKPLTKSGWLKEYPVFGAEGKIYYVNQDYESFPGIYELDLASGRSKRIVKKMGVSSLFYDRQDNKLYFSAYRYYEVFYNYSDIYAFDIKKGKLKRLSSGKRLSYPVEHGDNLYCVKREKTKSFLCVLDLKSGKEKIISGGFDGLAQLALSPDGQYIAASVKQPGKKWSIALFNMQGELFRDLSEAGDIAGVQASGSIQGDGSKSYNPQWQNNKRLYFISEDGSHYRLASYDLETGDHIIYKNSDLPDLKHFSLDAEGGRSVVSFFDAHGFNIGVLNLSDLSSVAPGAAGASIEAEPLPGQTPVSAPAADFRAVNASAGASNPQNSEFDKIKIKKYNFLRDLSPKYITLNSEEGDDGEVRPGIYLSGNDALEKHFFALGLYYSSQDKITDCNFSYIYDGLYPSLIFRYRYYIDIDSGDGPMAEEATYRHNKFELAALLPLSMNEKRQSYLYTGIHLEHYLSTYKWMEYRDKYSTYYYGYRGGYLFSSLKQYYDSISYADGLWFSVSYDREIEHKSDYYDIKTFALEYRHYLTISRPNVFALRFVYSDSWGKGLDQRYFTMGGVMPQGSWKLAGDNMFDLMRGFPADYFYGSGGFIVNAEYRISLFKIERVFNIIRSLDRVYLTLFADIGNLWHWRSKKTIDPHYSVGMELNLAAYIADLKLDISGGVGFGRNPYHEAIYYIRLGRSF